MARATMAALIGRVRSLIDDPAGASPVFSDDRLEELLDGHANLVRGLELELPANYVDGYTHWDEGFAPWGDWEDGVVLRDNMGHDITSTVTAADLKRGRWTWEPPLKIPYVALYGATYDVHAAAADALEEWAGKLAREYDITSDGQTFRRSQAAEALLKQAGELRRRARPVMGRMVRLDESGAYDPAPRAQ